MFYLLKMCELGQVTSIHRENGDDSLPKGRERELDHLLRNHPALTVIKEGF